MNLCPSPVRIVTIKLTTQLLNPVTYCRNNFIRIHLIVTFIVDKGEHPLYLNILSLLIAKLVTRKILNHIIIYGKALNPRKQGVILGALNALRQKKRAGR